MLVLPDFSSVFACPARLSEFSILLHDTLLEGEIVHHIRFAPSRCKQIYPRLLLLFSALGGTCGRIVCIWTTSSGPWYDVSTHECRTWKSSCAPKRLSLWKSSLHWRWSVLMLTKIISPFLIFQSIGQGFPRDCRAPSPSLSSSRSQFRRSPRNWRIGVWSWWVQTIF